MQTEDMHAFGSKATVVDEFSAHVEFIHEDYGLVSGSPI